MVKSQISAQMDGFRFDSAPAQPASAKARETKTGERIRHPSSESLSSATSQEEKGHEHIMIMEEVKGS
jgi:hypothetical protein